MGSDNEDYDAEGEGESKADPRRGWILNRAKQTLGKNITDESFEKMEQDEERDDRQPSRPVDPTLMRRIFRCSTLFAEGWRGGWEPMHGLRVEAVASGSTLTLPRQAGAVLADRCCCLNSQDGAAGFHRHEPAVHLHQRREG